MLNSLRSQDPLGSETNSFKSLMTTPNEYVITSALEIGRQIGANNAEIFMIRDNSSFSETENSFINYISAGLYSDDGYMEDSILISDYEMKELLDFAINELKVKFNKDHSTRVFDEAVLSKNIGMYLSFTKGEKVVSVVAELFSGRPAGEEIRNLISYAVFDDPIFGKSDHEKFKGTTLTMRFVGNPRRLFTDDVIPETGLLYLQNSNYTSLHFLDKNEDKNRDLIYRDLCLDAGLLYNCWKNDMTEIYYFRTKSIDGKIYF